MSHEFEGDAELRNRASSSGKNHRKEKSDRHEKNEKKKRKRDETQNNAEQNGSHQKPKKSKHTRTDQGTANNTRSHLDLQKSQPPLELVTLSLYLPASPITAHYALEGLCAEHLSPLILEYFSPAKGIILGYDNVRIAGNNPKPTDKTMKVAKSVDQYAVYFTWVAADFTVFKPARGAVLEGYITAQSEGHISLICWNLYSTTIRRKHIPSEWTWSEEAVMEGELGRFLDENNHPIEGMLKFKVLSYELANAFGKSKGQLTIKGTLVEEALTDVPNESRGTVQEAPE